MTATAQLRFAFVNTIPIGMGPSGASTMDIDGDGNLDIILSVTFGNAVITLLGDGNLGFTLGQILPSAATPGQIALADYNGDGNKDIAVVCRVSNELNIFFNLGNGTFGPRVSTPVGIDPLNITAVDFDSDGDQDLFIVNNLTNSLNALANDGTGTFNSIGSSFIGFLPTAIKFADLDGDSDLDAVVSLGGQNAVTILRNTGVALAPAGTFATGFFPIAIELVDLNHDSRLDIVTANVASDDVTILTNLGSLNFSAPVSRPTGDAPVGVTRINHDNAKGWDLVSTNFDGLAFTISNNSGTGVFSSINSTVFVGLNPVNLLVADFDGDFDDDVVTVNFTSNDLTVLRNISSKPPYPGTNEDLILTTGVDGPLSTVPTKEIHAGSLVTAQIASPLGTFNGMMSGIGVQAFLPAFPPLSPFPGLYLNQFGFGASTVLNSAALLP
ncbi:MAG: VCBS repeat-containing protein, partial [Planctomycetes bacterium]|nr:VCBS repeat-containing protein [Planctomycetota bacterium]